MVLTKRFWLLAALGIPLAALAAAIGQPILAVGYDVLLLAAAYASTRLAPQESNLRFARKFDPVLSVRAANQITLVLENDGPEPIRGELRDEPPPEYQASQRQFDIDIAPGDLKELRYTLVPEERGANEFRGTWLRIDCPLGLAQKQVVLPTEQPIRVYPNVLALKEFDLLNQRGRLNEIGIRRSRMRGLGMEFESLREYAEGDDYRKIDWKATARKGKLVVRQFEQERNQSIILCIDVGRHMLAEVNGVRKLDHVLDALLMLTNAASIAGDAVGLLVYADQVRQYLPPAKGRRQVTAIVDAIHDLVAEPIESDPVAAFGYLSARWKRRSLLVCFTDYEDPDRAGDLVMAIGPMARRHLAIVVRVTDPRIDEITRSRVETVPQMYLKASATMLSEDRRAAASAMAAAKLHTLDSEPQDLARKLVNYYFTVKERSLI